MRVQLALAGISAAEMARRIGMPLSTFAARMAGDVPFLASEIVAVAAQLRVPAATLFEQAEAEAVAALAAEQEPAEAGAA